MNCVCAFAFGYNSLTLRTGSLMLSKEAKRGDLDIMLGGDKMMSFFHI